MTTEGTSPSEITRLLHAWNDGDRASFEKLISLVEKELSLMARARLANERVGHTLEPAALVNEVYLRIAGLTAVSWTNRAHFFGACAEMMRRILVDHARRKKAARHGSGKPPVPLEEALGLPIRVDVDLVALDDALKELSSLAPRQSEAIQLSYFGGLTFDEIAVALEVSPATVKRDLKTAKIWLLRELKDEGSTLAPPAPEAGEAET